MRGKEIKHPVPANAGNPAEPELNRFPGGDGCAGA